MTLESLSSSLGELVAALAVVLAVIYGPRLAYRFIYHRKRSRWAREIGGR